jgi:hypothetical protein
MSMSIPLENSVLASSHACRGPWRRPLPVLGVVLAVLLASCALPFGPPLTLTDCGWPADTELAFEGWSTEAALGLQQSHPSGSRRYWLISAEEVPFMTSRGEGMARGACSVGEDGLRSFQTIPDDWMPPSS